MEIEAICASGNSGNGVMLPTYLIRASHKDVMLLGGKHFTQGEILTLPYQVDKLKDALREVSRLIE
jgi:hypothetical protein